MRPPKIPPMVTDIVQSAICAFDNLQFTSLPSCPHCGGKVQGYDTRQKKFALIREGGRERTISVRVKRFTCRDCHRLINADEPFYPDTRIGSIIVDMYFTLAATMPNSRAARVMEAMGVVVDRTTWRNYTGRRMPDIPYADVFGVRLPLSVIQVSTIAARTADGEAVSGTETLAASGYPSSFRSPEEITDTRRDPKKRNSPGQDSGSQNPAALYPGQNGISCRQDESRYPRPPAGAAGSS